VARDLLPIRQPPRRPRLPDTQGERPRLLHVYFTGDRFPDNRECPADAEAWRVLIDARRLTLGLPKEHPLSDRVHEVFLPVLGRDVIALR
jgi:hypothetical protein